MLKINLASQTRGKRWRVALGFMIFLVLGGCGSSEVPLNPEAKAFKTEMQECINRLVGPLVEPVARKDIPAINKTLAGLEANTERLCRMCPFQIGVLDAQGDALAVYPARKDMDTNFASYGLVAKVLKDKKILQQRFFLQDGSEIYIIGAPLMQGGKVVGLLALSLSSEEAKRRWGISEQEFLGLNFNT